ncbi:type VI secretion system-associated FHA domain protein TagH [Pelagibius sp. Alg239-R121]|uniref:type VI secretion system-associated FHA domain protein TagH n=1 Tax=Pelagibius sp. Alg239-R121 TaxID=2993448 RepID=UPI0024A74332|nr:type VI secretion system-associated FHA domain protein TagH [Pelagibius sp. Alg239-R121]
MTIVGDVRPTDPQDISHSFGAQGGRIGRGLSNEWVLPDPHMSKNHCSVLYRDGQFVLTDTSTNGVFVNGSPERMERGSTVTLADGDSLKIGDYEIRLEVDESAESGDLAPAEDLDSFAQVLGVGIGEDLDPFEINSKQQDKEAPAPGPAASPDVLGVGANDPFDDLLDQPATGPSREDPLFAGTGVSGAVIPEDDDLFDDLLPSGATGREAPVEPVPSEQDHVPSANEFFQPPKVSGDQIPDDWDADDLLGGAPETPAPAPPASPPPASPPPTSPSSTSPPPRPEPVMPAQGQSAAPEPVPPPAPPQPAPQAPAAVSPQMPVSDAEAALLRAFLEGAEMTELDIPEAARIELMRTVGQTYRDLVRGLVEVLKVRQTIKNEFRLDQTMIRADSNNPLKFTVNVEEALKAMLSNTSRGYLTPRQAVDQGFADIKAHQIAVMAGMQVALQALLTRFDPKELEDRLTESSVLDKVLPGSKKARYWELFTQLYAEIAKEAEDDFHGLFGREFARAYEEQAKKV